MDSVIKRNTKMEEEKICNDKEINEKRSLIVKDAERQMLALQSRVACGGGE